MAETSITQSLLTNDIPLEQQPSFEPLEKMFYEPGHSAGLDTAQKKIEGIKEQQSSFMPTFLAVASALTGNFGPAIQMQEQKRKTNIIQQALPAMNEISRMKVTGQYEPALQALEMLSSKVGPRVPELKEMFMQQQKDLSDKQTALSTARGQYNVMKPYVTKNHPDKALFDSAGAALKAGTPGAAEMFKTILDNRVNMQNQGGQNIMTSGLTGGMTTQPIPETYETKDVENYVGINVAQAHGLTTQDLANVLKGITVPGVGEQKAETIKKDYIGLQDINAKLDLAKLIPLEPILSTQMLETENPLAIATREVAKGTSSAVQRHMGRLTQQKVAEYEGQISADPTMGAKADTTYVDVSRPGSTAYGREVPLMTIKALSQSGGTFQPVRRKVYDEVFVPVTKAKQGLGMLPDLIKEMGDPQTPLERASRAFNMVIRNVTGFSPKAGMTTGAAIEAIINNSMELVERTKTVSSAEVGLLKKLTTGKGADFGEAAEAVGILMNRLDSELGRIVGEENIPTSQMQQQPGSKLPYGLEKIKKGYERHQQQSAPTQQQQLEQPTVAPSGIIEGSGKKSRR